jgi:hypothetical protein
MTDLEPGLYVTRAGDEEYGLLDALVVEGEATFIGERYDTEGRKEIAVNVHGAGMTPNVKVPWKIAEDFSHILRDYSEWREKWFREVIQNGVDAGARNIACSVQEQADGTWLVSCEDDGRGMNQDTILNKFLAEAGTTKTVGGTLGGFGRAKELLTWPWLAWEMHTQDWQLTGVGKAEPDMEPAPYRKGTRLSVVMPADKATTAAAAIAFIGKCNVPHVKFTVNGEVIKARLAPGDVLRDVEGQIEVCYDKKAKDPFKAVIVRVKSGDVSLAMFSYNPYIDDFDSIPGQITIEIIGRSVDILTSNRDGFENHQLKRAVERFVGELAVDSGAALRKKKGLIREKYEGKRYRAEATSTQSALLQTLGRMQPEGKRDGTAHDLSKDQITEMVNTLLGFADDSDEESLTLRVRADSAEVMLGGMGVRGANHMEAIAKQLAWQPSFYLRNDVENFNVPKKYRPEHMTKQIRLLASLWAEMCRFVMMQLGSSVEFGVGFCFEDPDDLDSALAMYCREGDEHWLLVNPVIGDPRREEHESLSISGDVVVRRRTIPAEDYLYALAVHECTHMADGITGHNVSFASALTMNMALTANKDKQVRALKRIALAQEKETKARLKAGPKAPTLKTAPTEPERLPELPDLVDHELEKNRRDTVAVYEQRSPGKYRLFHNERISVEEDGYNLNPLISYAVRGGEDEDSSIYGGIFEIRNSDGDPVWRSANFDLPVRGPAPAQASYVLPELEATELAERRRYNMPSDSGLFAAYRGDTAYAWDTHESLENLIKAVTAAMRQQAELGGAIRYVEMFEIRNAHGDPVWRSENFDAPLQGATPPPRAAPPERALPELEDSHLADARRRIAEGTGDPFVAFRGHTGVDYYGTDDNLISLVESLTNEPSYGAYDWEIRTWRGDPVWRSSDFGTSNPYLRLAE